MIAEGEESVQGVKPAIAEGTVSGGVEPVIVEEVESVKGWSLLAEGVGFGGAELVMVGEAVTRRMEPVRPER